MRWGLGIVGGLVLVAFVVGQMRPDGAKPSAPAPPAPASAAPELPPLPPAVYEGERFELAGVTIGQPFDEAQSALRLGASSVEDNGMPPSMYGDIYIRPEGRVGIYSNIAEGNGGPETRYVNTIVVEKTSMSSSASDIRQMRTRFDRQLTARLGQGTREVRDLNNRGIVKIDEKTWASGNVTITLSYEQHSQEPASTKVKATAN